LHFEIHAGLIFQDGVAVCIVLLLMFCVIREKFINESMGFQANMLKSSNEDLVLLLNEKSSLEDESAKLKVKINSIHSSSKEYIAEILEEVNTENSG
jgi:hypothetical protein